MVTMTPAGLERVSPPPYHCGYFWVALLVHLAWPAAAQNAAPPGPGNVVRGTIVFLDPEGREISDRSDFVVFVDGLAMSSPSLTGETPQQLAQKGQRFAPHVLPILKSSTVDFLNDDNIFHNVFSLSRAKTFDLGVYPKGTSRFVTFEQVGLVRIYCNIHPNMASSVVVLANPLFAKTSADGAYVIRGVPDGTITLRVWHELTDGESRQLVVGGGDSHVEDFTITRTRSAQDHKNKFGKPYRNKYSQKRF